MRKLYAISLIAGAMAAGLAGAATTTTTFARSHRRYSTCSATATALAFSAYTPGGGNVANNSTISVKCTKNSPFTVALNLGTTAGGTVAQRLMSFGANTLQYNLNTTAAFTTVFGDGSGASQTEAEHGSR